MLLCLSSSRACRTLCFKRRIAPSRTKWIRLTKLRCTLENQAVRRKPWPLQCGGSLLCWTPCIHDACCLEIMFHDTDHYILQYGNMYVPNVVQLANKKYLHSYQVNSFLIWNQFDSKDSSCCRVLRHWCWVSYRQQNVNQKSEK